MKSRRKKRSAGILLAGLFLVLCSPTAFAHKVSVFAWIEENEVHGIAKFFGGKPIKKAGVAAYDESGKQVAESITDEKGEFNIPLDTSPPIRIVVDAGMGHQAQWIIEKEDIETSHSTNDADVDSLRAIAYLPPDASSATDTATIDCSAICMDRLDGIEAESRRMIKEEMSRLRADLISKHDEPDIKDILGAIGYIFGLVGIAAYVHARSKQKEQPR